MFKDLIDTLNFTEDCILWLFYLPIVYKNLRDKMQKKIKKNSIKSLCSLTPSKTHPLILLVYDKNRKINQFIKMIFLDVKILLSMDALAVVLKLVR